MYFYSLLTRKTLNRPLRRLTLAAAQSDIQVDGQVLELKWPEENSHRSRKVVTRSRARATGKYPSWKMNRMIQWESTYERDVYLLLDADPDVVSFHEQPLVVSYVLNGEQHIHYPDVLVKTRQGDELWEIKTHYESQKPKIAVRTALMSRCLPTRGFGYQVVLGDRLDRAMTANARTLVQYGREPISSVAREVMRVQIKGTENPTWGCALNNQFGPGSMAQVCRLMLEGFVRYDTSSPLTATSPLWWSDHSATTHESEVK